MASTANQPETQGRRRRALPEAALADPLLNLGEVAEYIRKSHKFVWEQCTKGMVLGGMDYLVAGRTWLVRKSEVDRWLDSQTRSVRGVGVGNSPEAQEWLEQQLKAKGLK